MGSRRALTVAVFVALLMSTVGAVPARAATPANDEQSGALRLDNLYLSTSTLDVQYYTLTSTNVGATKAAGEPNIAGDPGGASVWFLEYPGVEDVPFSVDTVGSSFPTLLAVYSRDAYGNPTLVGEDKGSAGGGQSRVSNINIPVPTNGFYIVVDGAAGATGTIVLRWYLTPPANDDLANAQAISGASGALAATLNTAGATVQPGEPGVAPAPTLGGSYVWKTVWYRWTAPATGTYGFDAGGSTPLVSRSSIAPNFLPRVSIFTGADLASLAAAPLVAGTGTATVVLSATAGTSYAIQIGGQDPWHGWTQGHLMLAWGATPANDNFANAQVLGTSGTATGTTLGSTLESGEPQHATDGNHTGSVWFTYTAAATGTLNLDVAGSFPGAAVAAYSGSVLTTLTQLGSTGGSFTSNTRLAIPVHTGDVVRVAVSGRREGAYSLAYAVAGPPNDEQAGAIRLDNLYLTTSTLDVQYLTLTSTNLGATKASGEPNIAGDPGGASVWYLEFPGIEDAPFTVDTVGSDFPTLLAVYGRDAYGSATLVGEDKGSAGGGQSRVANINIPVPTNGFYIVVDGVGGASGTIVLRWYLTPPANDDLANAATLTGASGTLASTVNTAGATVQPGEPGTAPYPTFNGDYVWKTIWYRWTAPATGRYGFDAAGSTRLVSRSSTPLGFLPRVSVFTGNDVASLATVPLVGGGGTATVVFAATAGTTYDIQVGGLLPWNGWTQGHVALAWGPTPANDDFANAQVLGAAGTVTGTTLGSTIEAGEPMPSVDTTTQLGSVWFRYTAPSSGSFVLDAGGSFAGVAVAAYSGSSLAALTELGSAGGPFSTNRRLVILVNAGDVISVAITGKKVGSYTLTYGIAAPPNDERSGAIRLENMYLYSTNLTTQFYSLATTNAGATKGAGEPNIAGDPGGASVWFFEYPGIEDVPMSVDTVGSNFPTLLAVYRADAYGNLTLVGEDKGSAGGGQSRVSNINVPLATYGFYIVVDGVGGASGAINLRWYITPPANDDFANAQTITGASGSLAGPNSAGATSQAGEPGTAPAPTFNGDYVWKTVWYRWTAPASARYGFDAGGSTRLDSRSYQPPLFLPRLSVFTGSDVASLSPVPLVSGMGQATVVFDAVAGTTYDIQIGGLVPYQGWTQGHVALAWGPTPANDDFANARSLTGATGSTQGSTLGSTWETGEPLPSFGGTNQGGTVWFTYAVATTGTLNLDSAGSFGGSGIVVYSGSSLGTLTQLAEAGGPFTSNTRIVLLVRAGDVLRIQLSGQRVGAYSLAWSATVADTTPPVITPTIAGTLGTNGWYVSDVTVTWSVSDPDSSITSSTGCATTSITTDTAAADITCSATSTGGTTTQTVTIKRDTQAPAITASRTPANAAGWSNGDITVSFACTDALSLVASCPSSVVLVSEGAGQMLVGTATDGAGNSASVPVNGLNIDRTVPATIASPSVPADPSGAYPQGLIVTLSCNDALSGCAQTDASVDGAPFAPYAGSLVLSGAGSHTVAYRSTDLAGNVEPTVSAQFTIDATGPVVTPLVTGTLGTSGWYVSDVSVSWTVSDAESTVLSSAGCGTSTITTDTAGTTFTCEAKSTGGTSVRSVTIKRDTQAPTITGARTPAANADGWSNGDITVTFSCADALSLVASCTAPVVVTTEGAGQSATGTAVDGAGNSATAVVSSLNLDRTPPATTATPSAAPDASGLYQAGLTITLACADALSGCARTEFTLDGSAWTAYGGPIALTTGGSHLLTYRSTDRAGNAEGPRSATYRVEAVAPEASIEFDPLSKDVTVRGRNGAAVVLVSTTPIAGDDDHDAKPNERSAGERRTYRVTNAGGGSLTIVLAVKREGHEIKASVVSLRYNDRPAVKAPRNSLAFEWSTAKNGDLRTLQQDLRVGESERKTQATASYDARAGLTVVRTEGREGETRGVRPGLFLLKLATDHGVIVIVSE